MSVRITIRRGPKVGQSYEFDKDEITIGSGRNNDVIILDNDVSTTHCRLLRVEKDYDIEDLGSRYGTFVNGQRIRSAAFTLPLRAIIELGGQVTIEYEILIEEPKADEKPNPIYLVEGDPSSQPVLVQMEEKGIKEAFFLESEELTIGRSTDNDIIIQEIDISRRHVKLIWKNKRYYVQDLNSRNGSFLNGERVKGELEMHHSDVLQLGATVRLHLIFRSNLPEEFDKRSTMETPIPGAEKMRPTQFSVPRPKSAPSTKDLPIAMTEGELKDHIFLVYAREEWETIVATIYTNLNDAKQNVWADQHLRPGSEAWKASIEQAHRECWLLLVVMSPSSMRNSYVKDQYRYFYNREKPIIVVEYKTVGTLPFQLTQVPRIRYDPEEPGKMFQRLLYEIMRMKPRYLSE